MIDAKEFSEQIKTKMEKRHILFWVRTITGFS